MTELAHEPWYVIENDLVGGWSIGTVDKPLSLYDNGPGSTDGRVIADVTRFSDAAAIVTLREVVGKAIVFATAAGVGANPSPGRIVLGIGIDKEGGCLHESDIPDGD